jgi:WD40 repeat protein
VKTKLLMSLVTLGLLAACGQTPQLQQTTDSALGQKKPNAAPSFTTFTEEWTVTGIPKIEGVTKATWSNDGNKIVVDTSKSNPFGPPESKSYILNSASESTMAAGQELSLSPNGTYAVESYASYPYGYPYEITLLDVNAGQRAQTQRFTSFYSWSPTNQFLSAGSSYNSLCWTLINGPVNQSSSLTKICPGYDLPGSYFSWSADGTRSAIITSGKVRVLETSSGASIMVTTGRSYNRLFGFSPNGAYLTASSDAYPNEIKIIDATNGQTTSTIFANASRLAWSPNSAQVAVGGAGIYDASSGTQVVPIVNEGEPIWNSDGSRLALVGASEVALINAGSGSVITSQPITANSFAWHPNGQRWLAVPDDNTLRVFNASNGLQIASISTPGLPGGAWKPGSESILLWDDVQPGVRLWNPSSNQIERRIREKSVFHENNVYSLTWSPDGSRIIDAGRDGRMLSMPSETGEIDASLTGHAGGVYAVAYSPDGTNLASAGNDGTVKLWNPATGENMQTLSGHTFTVRSLAWNPSGSMLASGSWDNSIKLWNPSTGEELRTLTGHSNYVNAIAFNPAGTRLASVSSDKSLKLWNPSTGELLATLNGHTDSLFTLAWSPDGSRLATAGADKTIRIWNASTLALEQTITASFAAVRTVVWTKDGQGLLSGGDDNKVHLWDATSGQESATSNWSINNSAIFNLTWKPNGNQLAIATQKGEVRLYTVQ